MVNSMTSISVGLVLRLASLFVVSLHPGIKMVQYPSLFLVWGSSCSGVSSHPEREKGWGVTILLGASCHRKKVTPLAIWACFSGSPSSKYREKTAYTKTHKMVIIGLAHLTGKQ